MFRAIRVVELALGLVVGLVVATTTRPSAAKPLSEEDLVTLTRLAIGDDILIAKAQKEGIAFTADDAAIERLKKAGVSDAVLAVAKQVNRATPTAAAAPAVTYDDVLRLLDLKIDEVTILDRLQRSPVLFTLGAAQVEELRNKGASQRLIDAMQAGRAATPAPASDITDFAIILDCSGSMMEKTSEGPTKMEAAKKVVTELVQKVPDGLRLTFIVYGHDKALQCKAVKVLRELGEIDAAGKAELSSAIAALQPSGATPIALALHAAAAELAKHDAKSGVVLVSDGKETCQGNPAAEAAALAGKAKLGVHVIGFDVKPDERLALEEIAKAGKGEYHNAQTAAQLGTMLMKVAERVEVAARPAVEEERMAFTMDESVKEKPTWQTLKIVAGKNDFRKIAFPTRDVGFAASDEAIYRTTDGGKTWKAVLQANLDRVYFLWFRDAQNGWFANRKLYVTDDGGETWTPQPEVEDMLSITALAVAPDGAALLGGMTSSGNLQLYRRRAGAAEWEKLRPEKAGYWGGPQEPHRTDSLGRLVFMGPGDAIAVLADRLDARGTLLRTRDGGETWQTVFTAPKGLHDIHFADANRGWLLGNRGALWTTQDGGQNWRPQLNPVDNDLTRLAFDPYGSAFGIAPHHRSKALMTLNGKTWTIIDTGLGYVMPDAVVVDPGCAYVLGEDGTIARYLDPRVKVAGREETMRR